MSAPGGWIKHWIHLYNHGVPSNPPEIPCDIPCILRYEDVSYQGRLSVLVASSSTLDANPETSPYIWSVSICLMTSTGQFLGIITSTSTSTWKRACATIRRSAACFPGGTTWMFSPSLPHGFPTYILRFWQNGVSAKLVRSFSSQPFLCTPTIHTHMFTRPAHG